MTSMTLLRRVICLAAAFTSLLIADYGSGQSQDQSLRELCRKYIAGKYLTAFDERRRAEDFASELRKRQTDLEASKAKALTARKKLSKEKAENNNTRYDVEAERTRKAKQQFVDDLSQRLIENKDLLKKNDEAFRHANQVVTTLEPRLKRVFTIEILKSDLRREFPFSMTYKESCARFQSDCKMSKGSAYDLLMIFDSDEAVPEPCIKYAAQSGVTR